MLALVAGTAFVFSLALGITGRTLLVLAVYTLGFAEVVALGLFLSVFDAFSRGVLVAAAALIFVAALGIWWLRTSPRPQTWRAQVAAPPAPVLLLGAVAAVATATSSR
jgi:hypothetical protein